MQTSKEADVKCVGENLWLRHGWYYARLKKNGKDIWKSLKTSDRGIADAGLLEFKGKVNAHTANPAKEEIPIFQKASQVLRERAKYETRRPRTLTTLDGSLNCVDNSFLGPLLINRITAAQVKDYLYQRAQTRSGRTANHDLTALKKIFALAIERGWRWDDPCQGIKQFPHKEKKVPVPSLDEIKTILAALRDGRMKNDRFLAADFIELLALSGLRLSEAQALQWEDIDLEKGILMVREGKGGKSRVVDLFPSLRAFVERMMVGRRKLSGPVFPSEDKQPYRPKRALATACKLTGVPRFTFHGLRHAWATELVKAGIDFGTIAQWAGHSDGGLLIAKRYGRHMRRDHMQVAAQKATFTLA